LRARVLRVSETDMMVIVVSVVDSREEGDGLKLSILS